jgi:hypothetical protein
MKVSSYLTLSGLVDLVVDPHAGRYAGSVEFHGKILGDGELAAAVELTGLDGDLAVGPFLYEGDVAVQVEDGAPPGTWLNL